MTARADSRESHAVPEQASDPPGLDSSGLDSSGLDSSGLTALIQQATDTSSDIARLFLLETRLALSSLHRLFWLALTMVPLLGLLWLALSLLPCVLLYDYTRSLLYGLMLFSAIQLAAIAAVVLAWRRCTRDLGLPRTRQQLRRFSGALRGET